MNVGKALLVARGPLLTAEWARAQQVYTADDVPRIENLIPLNTYLSKPTEEQIPHYPFQRCSGLFLGYNYYTGATFDSETRQTVEVNIDNLRTSAWLIELMTLARRRGVSLDELSQAEIEGIINQSGLQVEGFAFFYDDRLEENYLTQGAAFSEDPLITGDLTICSQFAEAAIQIASQVQ